LVRVQPGELRALWRTLETIWRRPVPDGPRLRPVDEDDIRFERNLRVLLDGAARELGYDGVKLRGKVDRWLKNPGGIDWLAEIEEARRNEQEVRLGEERIEEYRRLLGEHD
jgi:hypothetical protein